MVQVIGEDPLNLARAVGTRYALGIIAAEGKGRCVISHAAIAPGQIIEVAPTLVFEKAERERIDGTTLANYYFNLGRTDRGQDMSEFRGCIPLGASALCNHSPQPNAECVVVSSDAGFFFVLSSLRDIVPGEEICIEYRDPWFEPEPPVFVHDMPVAP